MHSLQVSGEFPLSSNVYGDQMLSSSLHKRVHPYPVSEPGKPLSLVETFEYVQVQPLNV